MNNQAAVQRKVGSPHGCWQQHVLQEEREAVAHTLLSFCVKLWNFSFCKPRGTSCGHILWATTKCFRLLLPKLLLHYANCWSLSPCLWSQSANACWLNFERKVTRAETCCRCQWTFCSSTGAHMWNALVREYPGSLKRASVLQKGLLMLKCCLSNTVWPSRVANQLGISSVHTIIAMSLLFDEH